MNRRPVENRGLNFALLEGYHTALMKGRYPVCCLFLEIDPSAHTALLNGRELNLSPREYDLLYALVRNAGKLVTTDDLLAQVWGAEFNGQPQVVYVHIRWLREKLEEDPEHPRRIVTVRGVGYRLVSQGGEVGNAHAA